MFCGNKKKQTTVIKYNSVSHSLCCFLNIKSKYDESMQAKCRCHGRCLVLMFKHEVWTKLLAPSQEAWFHLKYIICFRLYSVTLPSNNTTGTNLEVTVSISVSIQCIGCSSWERLYWSWLPGSAYTGGLSHFAGGSHVDMLHHHQSYS